MATSCSGGGFSVMEGGAEEKERRITTDLVKKR